MKKLVTLLAALAVALSFTACTALPTVNTNPITGITAEKIAGTYTLADTFEMGQIQAADFEENTLALTADGHYTFTVSVKDGKNTTETGSYSVADNGVVTLGNEAYIAMKGETITASGDRITVAKSAVGTQARVEMIYLRADEVSTDDEKTEQNADTDQTVAND